MRHALLIFPILLLLTGCQRKSENKPVAVSNTNTVTESAESLALKTEQARYVNLLNKRLYQLEGEIREVRARRQAEKDEKKRNSYNRSIIDKETHRVLLREKLDDLETRTQQEWFSVKAELDTLFETGSTKNKHNY